MTIDEYEKKIAMLERQLTRDRNARKAAEELLENKSRELFSNTQLLEINNRQLKKLTVAVEQSPNSILITDLKGNIEYTNPVFTELTGWTFDEIKGKSTKILASDETPYSTHKDLWDTIQSGNIWKGEIYNKKKNGEQYLQEISISPIKDEQGNVHNYLSISEDITLRKEQEEHIHHLAHHDTLTGLYNRFSLEHRLEQSLALAMRNDHQLAVLFLDLDRFKAINDTLGHKAGDELLIQVANRLRGICQRKSDVIARIGGDEFVIILSEINSPSFAALTAKAIVEILSVPYLFENEEMLTTPSIGIAVFPSDGDDCESILKKADDAMYHVKKTGRGNYEFYTEEINKHVQERIVLEKDLKIAIKEDNLELYYQPQILSSDNSLCCVEALLRWNHPEMGFISPETFVSIAEETSLINELGLWVINTAFKQLANWQKKGFGHIRMAINISAKQLESDSLLENVREHLQKYNIAPSMIEFEVTESTAMNDPFKAIKKLEQLRELGIELSIDDFGTGYSSLSYLKMLPVQSLKLDKSFVMNIESDVNNKAISLAAISLGHDLGFKVVAEGVETEQQEAFLKANGCDLLQGYYFSKPQNSANIEKFFNEFKHKS